MRLLGALLAALAFAGCVNSFSTQGTGPNPAHRYFEVTCMHTFNNCRDEAAHACGADASYRFTGRETNEGGRRWTVVAECGETRSTAATAP